jgi:hypothetical protein
LSTARFSTAVMPEGMEMTTRGLISEPRRRCTLRMKYDSIFSVMSKSAITPSFIGRMALIDPGVLPSISLAARPTALPFWRTLLVPRRTATTEGSFSTTPCPRAHTSVLQVPRSTPMSIENSPRMESKIMAKPSF